MIYNEVDFENIYRATYPVLSRFIFSKTRNEADGQDLLQEVYYAFYKHIQKITEKIDNPQAYLIKMAENELSSYYAKLSKKDITLIDKDFDIFDSIPDDFELEVDILNKISTDLIWKEIEKIKEPDKSILIARFRFDMKYPEISTLFELPETTVKTKVYSAIEHLKKIFKK
jgi:RNA polymerase sigma-70 factor, ECF subfamily